MEEQKTIDGLGEQEMQTLPIAINGRTDVTDNVRSLLSTGELSLEKFGYLDDTGEGEYDASPKWINEHTAITSNGSVVAGVLHGYSSKSVKDLIDTKVLPRILSSASSAQKSGKKVVFLAEGAVRGPQGSEQEVIAQALDANMPDIEHDTWDDSPVDIFSYGENGEHLGIDTQSPVVQKMAKKYQNVSVVEAGLFASMHGQGEELSLSPAAKEFLQTLGIDSTDKDALYHAAFESNSVLAHVTNEWNRLRQENLLRKVHTVEQEGSIAIVTPGASHAYSLKFILENHIDNITDTNS